MVGCELWCGVSYGVVRVMVRCELWWGVSYGVV